MNLTKFAQNVISQKDLNEIETEIKKYYFYVLDIFDQTKIIDVTPSKEKEEAILKSITHFFPYLLDKEIQGIFTDKNFHYIFYLGFAWNTNEIFFNEKIIFKKRQNYMGSYDYEFFPIKKNVYLKYNNDDKEKNSHIIIDEQIKLNSYTEYQKINYLIYLLQRIIHFCETNNYDYIDRKPYQNFLYKVYAMVLLDETEPMNFIKEDFEKIKQKIISDHMDFKDIKKYLNLVES